MKIEMTAVMKLFVKIVQMEEEQAVKSVQRIVKMEVEAVKIVERILMMEVQAVKIEMTAMQ